MGYDLHVHSQYSDGTQSVADLVKEISQSGLSGFALTDHDTTVGWVEAAQNAGEYGLDFVPAMEISCAAMGTSVHLLSYLHDPTFGPLLEEIGRARDSRLHRAQKMVQRLSADFPITWEDVMAHTGEGATVGRPHIADALVSAGVIENRSLAFTSILTPDSPYYVSHYAVNPVKAVQLVRQAGGVPILAHPRARKRGRVIPELLIEEMIVAGLAGLEVRHRDNSPEDQYWLEQLAQSHQLLSTGSSDYHGAGKPNRLGENTTEAEVVAQIREQSTYCRA